MTAQNFYNPHVNRLFVAEADYKDDHGIKQKTYLVSSIGFYEIADIINEERVPEGMVGEFPVNSLCAWGGIELAFEEVIQHRRFDGAVLFKSDDYTTTTPWLDAVEIGNVFLQLTPVIVLGSDEFKSGEGAKVVAHLEVHSPRYAVIKKALETREEFDDSDIELGFMPPIVHSEF